MVDGDYSRHLLRLGAIKVCNRTLCNGGTDRPGIKKARKVVVGGIHRRAAHLQRTVYAASCNPDNLRLGDLIHRFASYAIWLTCPRVCTRQRLASSTLNPF